MKREILISATQREVRVAIIEDDQLVELQVDRPENKRMVGDIYLGKVEAVLPGIQAAFVNIGTEKAAFLHNTDLVYDEDGDDDADDDGDDDDEEDASEEADGPEAAAGGEGAAPEPRRRGGRRGGGRRRRKEAPKIEDVLKRGQSLIVQVSKEPISTKGPRVTAQVSLAGRFLVYMPFASRVGVSRKIGERAERRRLRAQVESVLPKEKGGVIVRTVGEDVTQETFSRELQTLIGQWDKVVKKQKFVGAPPKLLHRETSLTRGIIRDLFSTKVDRLTVDSKQVFNEVVEYLTGIAPELIDRVQLHEDKVPLFDKAGVETEIRDLFKRRCDLPSGGYIIIEPTEALVSIDVNSGRFTGKKDPEKTVTKTNLEAAREIARQLRLRDVGGIIVCDFIDMETKASRDKVLQELRTHLGRDRSRTKAYAVSDLGLIEMTRQRVRQSHFHAMTEPCPICAGTGRVFTAETIVRRMERAVRRVASEGRRDALVVKLPPEVALYVLQEEKELMRRLEKGIGFGVELRDDPLLRPDEFKLVVKGAGRDITSQYAVA
ncbi:MAG: Rne/Rng family ribonuclease [Gemmatimonadota bacterium]|nr:Rne/Rng family ribonuclease [Gemmatimonadota bacterium]MDQ8146921.1 Rne/Rng family ribonuclease [Gemmatimonadota bacterium]MDQ8148806.1 Rne/Rng family ribonuclease [Gemmatimonadota bacterium]MDQ8157084.1 Rne/Rng family ribonuclease [Gemmatimonadota bacterium]MDQ8176554.1 Rne/Rng family ribonuclease [Gemmatimonadota bacterium]